MASVTADQEPITAAVLVIGDEILSGRTKDKNIGYIADYLSAIGIDLREVRVVADVEEDIVAAVNALRSRYTYVFSTGGIGPTHDDITADAVAKAFGVTIDFDPRAVAILAERYGKADLNEARMRMARIPAGAELIENSVSKAPGFTLGNVHVMAGVPAIMQAMLDALGPASQDGAQDAVALGARRDGRGEDRQGAGGGPGSLSRRADGELSRPSTRAPASPPRSFCARARKRGSRRPRRRCGRCSRRYGAVKGPSAESGRAARRTR